MKSRYIYRQIRIIFLDICIGKLGWFFFILATATPDNFSWYLHRQTRIIFLDTCIGKLGWFFLILASANSDNFSWYLYRHFGEKRSQERRNFFPAGVDILTPQNYIICISEVSKIMIGVLLLTPNILCILRVSKIMNSVG